MRRLLLCDIQKHLSDKKTQCAQLQLDNREDPVGVISSPCTECEPLWFWCSPVAPPEKYHPENYCGLQRGDSAGHPPTSSVQS